jgi:hypothetical protein
MVSERRLLKWAVLKKWTPRQGSPRNLGLAVAQLSVPIGILIAFGSPYHSRRKWQRIGNQIDAAFIFTQHISCVHFLRDKMENSTLKSFR